MKKAIYFLNLSLLCAPALAEFPISYQEILTADVGSPDYANAIGKEVTVSNARHGMFGYFVKMEDSISFICRSGDPSLVKKSKQKFTSFKGKTDYAESHDGMTTWNLEDCQRVVKARAR